MDQNKLALHRSTAALALVGGRVTHDYPYHRYRDDKGRTFSVVLLAEREKTARHFLGYAKLSLDLHPRTAPELAFEVWVPEGEKALWRQETKKHRLTNEQRGSKEVQDQTAQKV